MFTLIVKAALLAIRFAIKRNRGKWNQELIDHQDNIGPLMTDDIALAMIERLGVFRM